MNSSIFTEQVEAMSARLESLYQGINTSNSSQLALLPTALKELGVASERLQVAAKMLYQQNQELFFAEQTVEAEQQRYQDLTEFITTAYLVTDANGVIQEVNRAAAQLFNLPQSQLLGRSLTSFVTLEARKQFETQLEQLPQRPWKQELQTRLQSYQGPALTVRALVKVGHQQAKQPLTLQWLLRDLSDRPLIDLLEPLDNQTEQNYPVQIFHKGETIPLTPQVIWQVRSGLVKLTTFSQSGQEVLVGLAGANAPFASGLTTLSLYEATALTDTHLWCISSTDFATSLELKQRLLPEISRRLQQAELLLTVYGQPRVSDRLYTLLQLLKQEIGQPVSDGVRLSVRLTHEDLASACCTTRVTITRLLNQFQQQKKLKVDAQHHVVLKD